MHPFVLAAGRRRELAAHVEQLVLDAPQRLRVRIEIGAELVAILRQPGAHDSDDRIQLVDSAVGLQAQAVLGHALAADQRGEPLIAGASVDASEPYRHQSPAFLRWLWYDASPRSLETGRPASRHPATITCPD